MPTSSMSLGELARENSSATRVFLRHRLDFCCGGRQTLAEACEATGLDPSLVLRELEQEAARGDPGAEWEHRPLSELASHIEGHYHAAIRRDVPSLIEAARRVEHVHASKPDVPAGLSFALERFLDEMQEHMAKEENILFPMIRRGARGEAVYMPVRVMESEHELHGARLAEIRALTHDLTLPANACATWTALYHGLEALEADLMQHIHLENNILFPRATHER